MKTVKFNATTLRNVLIVSILLLTTGLIGGFYYAQSWLNEMAVSVDETSSELAKADNDYAQSSLQNKLDSLKPVEVKASGLLYPSANYQDMVSADLAKYAAMTGAQIESVTPAQSPAGANAANITGAQTRYVKVTIKNPTDFNELVKLLKAIETNLPKMKPTGITITNIPGKDDSVTVGPLILEVYTK